jgi:hypothetical protein
MDSTAQIAPRDSKVINELMPRVTDGFHILKCPRDSEIINELESRERHGFDSPNSP